MKPKADSLHHLPLTLPPIERGEARVRDRGEDRSASGLLSTIRAKDPARALEVRGYHKRDLELTKASDSCGFPLMIVD